MADILIPISDIQQTLLDQMLPLVNEARAAQKPPLPPVTQDEWAAERLQRDIQQEFSNLESMQINRIAAAYQAATPSQKQQTKDILGVVPPEDTGGGGVVIGG